jgi:hypothetical protein
LEPRVFIPNTPSNPKCIAYFDIPVEHYHRGYQTKFFALFRSDMMSL